MLAAGVAWSIYSLGGRGRGDPTKVTSGNFLLSVPFAVALSIVSIDGAKLDSNGVGYAIASRAVASVIGYVNWYSVLPSLKATSAATIQLSVPVIAVFGGIVFLSSPDKTGGHTATHHLVKYPARRSVLPESPMSIV